MNNSADWLLRAKQLEMNARNFIDGSYADLKSFGNVNSVVKLSPRNGLYLYEFQHSLVDEVNRAVASAKSVFSNGCGASCQVMD